jgi:hypothetical protein
MKLEKKIANASIDEKIDMRIKFIEFLKIKYGIMGIKSFIFY